MGKIIDLTGQRFGKLTVCELAGKDKRGGCLWKCKCDCGGEIVASSANLRKGRYKGCGCQMGKMKENLIGLKFGMLTVIEEAEPYISPKGAKFSRWLCRCDCGNEKIATTSYLKNGKTNNCGCQTRNKKSKAKIKDITGERFGKLTVLELSHINHCAYWKCKCDCGNEVIVSSHNLQDGTTRSCGCIRTEDLTGRKFGELEVLEYAGKKERNSSLWRCRCNCGNIVVVGREYLFSSHILNCGCNVNGKVRHGMTKTRIHTIWVSMRQRCYNKNFREYDRYGGRGITVCQAWLDDFMNFYNWAMANGYSDELTLDRKDNDGNYCPENCRWATMEQQSNNRSSSKLITYNGETRTMAGWARKFGIRYSTLQQRISNSGWSFEKAISTPIKRREKKSEEK